MDRIHIIIVFIIAFIVYQHILWYVPHDYQYEKINESINIIHDISNIQNELLKPYPSIIDARQLFKYNWDNFEIPLLWIKEHLVSGKIELDDEEIKHETNVTYEKINKDNNFFSMFHQNRSDEFYACIYQYFNIPPVITTLYSTYENDIIVTQGDNHKSPWFYNHQTYHIFFIAKGDVTFKFLSRMSQKKNNFETDSIFVYKNKDYKFETKNIDEETCKDDIQSIRCNVNTMIIIPYHWIYMFETNTSSILLNYYYKSILNNVADNYLELNTFIHKCFK